MGPDFEAAGRRPRAALTNLHVDGCDGLARRPRVESVSLWIAGASLRRYISSSDPLPIAQERKPWALQVSSRAVVFRINGKGTLKGKVCDPLRFLH
jgi:hypothetical protein